MLDISLLVEKGRLEEPEDFRKLQEAVGTLIIYAKYPVSEASTKKEWLTKSEVYERLNAEQISDKLKQDLDGIAGEKVLLVTVEFTYLSPEGEQSKFQVLRAFKEDFKAR